MADPSVYDWRKGEISDPALYRGFLQDRSCADVPKPPQTAATLVLGFHYERSLYVNRRTTLATVSASLHCSLYAKHNPHDGLIILHHGAFDYHDLQQGQEPACRLHCSVIGTKLAAYVVLRRQITTVQNLVISDHVHHQSILQLGLHGLWYLHGWSTNMGWT